MMIGELEDGNLIEIEDDNEVDFLEVILEEGVMAKTKKVKFHGMELSISKKSLQDVVESVKKSIDDTIEIDARFIQKSAEKNVAGCLDSLCACVMPTAFFANSG